MKIRISISICVATLALVSFPCLAASETGFYTGLSLGKSYNKFDSEDTGKIMGPTTLNTVVESDTAIALMAGYQFTPMFGLEAEYLKLGQFKIHVTMPNGVGIAEDYKVDALTVAATVKFPVNAKFSAFGKIGVAATNVNDNYKFSNSPTLYSFSKSRTSALFGAGVSYAMTPQVDLRAQYQYLGEVGSAINANGEGTARAQASLFSFALVYRF